ncbi:hypothetical protein KKG82_04205 [Patescibacteria group bacterium]|nr:hypothetical protein [Patescibacteria group bacterium]
MKSEIEQHTYLTKRILLHATGKAIRETSARAMEMVGYLIRVDNGWIVKETADG